MALDFPSKYKRWAGGEGEGGGGIGVFRILDRVYRVKAIVPFCSASSRARLPFCMLSRYSIVHVALEILSMNTATRSSIDTYTLLREQCRVLSRLIDAGLFDQLYRIPNGEYFDVTPANAIPVIDSYRFCYYAFS